jgi:hypothetical protein
LVDSLTEGTRRLRLRGKRAAVENPKLERRQIPQTARRTQGVAGAVRVWWPKRGCSTTPNAQKKRKDALRSILADALLDADSRERAETMLELMSKEGSAEERATAKNAAVAQCRMLGSSSTSARSVRGAEGGDPSTRVSAETGAVSTGGKSH